MTFAEIIEELPKLTADERHSIVERALELDDEWQDSDAPLSDSEKALIEARFREMDENPSASVPWDTAKADLLARFITLLPLGAAMVASGALATS